MCKEIIMAELWDAYYEIIKAEQEGLITICRYDEFIKKRKEWLQKTIRDEFANSLLASGAGENMKALYQQYLVSGPLGYVKDLFESIGLEDAENKAV